MLRKIINPDGPNDHPLGEQLLKHVNGVYDTEENKVRRAGNLLQSERRDLVPERLHALAVGL